MFSGIKNVIGNHLALQKNPTTVKDIFNNQKLRYSNVKEIKMNTSTSLEGKQAIKKFWCMQTYFFVMQLQENRIKIAKYFPKLELLLKTLSKKNLVLTLEEIIKELNNKSLSAEQINQIIDLFITPNRTLVDKKENDNEKTEFDLPSLYIQRKDSIQFSYEQTIKNKKVLIMDAANSQRPGAAAYEKGTFQEALTRSTDLYWKILLDFRNVLKDLIDQRKSVVEIDEKDCKSIIVPDFQARFLKLILFFIKQSIIDDTYLEKNDFRKDFFEYAEGIYGDIQNKVLEIPTDGGFLKYTRIVDVNKFKKIKKTSDLFNRQDIFYDELLEEKLPNIWIAEVAAPDKRYIEGAYDKASTFNKDLQVCGRDDKASKIIESAITYTLDQAIGKNVDIIIINGFGCGAFLNSPTLVANIFSKQLAIHQLELRGKSIYFMDTSSEMCMIFGNIFSKTLNENFNVNFYRYGKNIDLNVMIDKLPIESITQENAVIIGAHNSGMIKKSFSFFGGSQISSIVRTIKNLDIEPKTELTLKKAYSDVILAVIEDKKTVIHMPLIGTGKLGFSISDSINALQKSLQELSEKLGVDGIKVYVYIPTKNSQLYHETIEYLDMQQKVDSSHELRFTNSCRAI